MIRLVPIRPPAAPIGRLWLVFFGEARGAAWWARFFAPGFRHVRAAAWYSEAQRWVLFDPSRRGLAIEVLTEAEFGPWFSMLLAESSLVLRFASRFERGSTPAAWHCVGAIKALLGIRSRALGPRGLARHLLAHGAEVVAPEREAEIVQPVQHTGNSAGGRRDGGPAEAATGAV